MEVVEGFVQKLLSSLAEPADIYSLQATLLDQAHQGDTEKTLAVRYVKNIVASSFRAFILWALECGYIEKDPFPCRMKWPKPTVPEADPFTVQEAFAIERWFAERRFGEHAGRASADSPRFHRHLPYAVLVSHVEDAGTTWAEWLREVDTHAEDATPNQRLDRIRRPAAHEGTEPSRDGEEGWWSLSLTYARPFFLGQHDDTR